MRFIYSLILGAALGAGSVFIHASLPPFGLILCIAATYTGVWSIGRLWGSRFLKIVASIVWIAVVLRAGFPGVSDEYLVQGNSIGTSLINIGFLALLLAIIMPA